MAIPIFRCADIERALAFYTGTLGATVLWRDRTEPGPAYVAVKWRDHEIHVSSHRGDGAFGAASYLAVDDVDAVFAELRAHGYEPPADGGPVHAGPCDQTWGTRELYVRDPDGNCLRFGCESAAR
jgi:catechol 2,3-dioxygenase-like lactoylglutathione lyase family enzyme